MSYVIAAISNSGGAPEQAYRKMQSAGACPERPFAGEFRKKKLTKRVSLGVESSSSGSGYASFA